MPSSTKLSNLSLSNALAEHVLKEKVSFHTPGHKGYSWQKDNSFVKDLFLSEDLTELPGLDELAHPEGILGELENKASQVWDTHGSLLSVNGATAGILASIHMLSKLGTHLLVPRNCHRSVIHALILTGLQPIWFEPQWEEKWDIWGGADLKHLENTLKHFTAKNPTIKIAGIIVTSPTYAGALTDVGALSALLKSYKIPLIVDEAHGAHLQWSKDKKYSALSAGGDIVIHSLHKTLSCPTQTGIVHVSKKGASQYNFDVNELRASLNLFQSSSPSYIFMKSIDQLVNALSTGKGQERIKYIELLGSNLQNSFQQNKNLLLYRADTGNTAIDVLIKHKSIDSFTLQELLSEKGVFAEAIMGNGLLFLLGIGSQQQDIDLLSQSLAETISIAPSTSLKSSTHKKCKQIEQALSPKEAFFMPSHVVPIAQAVGQISAECLAPCPPGWPILVPGQRITEEVLSFDNIKSVRIIDSNGKFQESVR